MVVGTEREVPERERRERFNDERERESSTGERESWRDVATVIWDTHLGNAYLEYPVLICVTCRLFLLIFPEKAIFVNFFKNGVIFVILSQMVMFDLVFLLYDELGL